MVNAIEHLFTCLWAICVSLKNYPFRFFASFLKLGFVLSSCNPSFFIWLLGHHTFLVILLPFVTPYQSSLLDPSLFPDLLMLDSHRAQPLVFCSSHSHTVSYFNTIYTPSISKCLFQQELYLYQAALDSGLGKLSLSRRPVSLNPCQVSLGQEKFSLPTQAALRGTKQES